MAIVQISQITNRKGLQVDLPQLAGAELGWSIDERRLFIGNGTLEEGAPVIGNTEILTEFSDILAFQTNYTYKGEAAGYVVQTGPTPSTPVSQSLQSWLDQFATVKDFGAVGDGVADDTDAINRALEQLYCRENNVQIRRSLFFPAGIYRVTQSIKIPPYAALYGEGTTSSVISLDPGDDSALNAYVARTADSLQQTGANIATNSATPPRFITISNMGFQTLDADADVFLVEDAENCRFQNVGFIGPLTPVNLTTAVPDIAGVRFASTSVLVCDQIVFDGCLFSGTTFGVNTDQQVKGASIINSKFDNLYQGIVLGAGTVVNGGPTGTKIMANLFDNIYGEGIILGDVSLNATGHNIFYDVGNHFAGVTNPATVIIDIESNNNVSVSDLFQRTDAFATTFPRIRINDTTSIATTNSKQINIGQYVRETGIVATLVNNTASPTSIFTVDATEILAFSVNYTIIRSTSYRTGTITVASSSTGSTGDLTYSDDYVENSSTGIVFTLTESSDTVSLEYTATNTGIDALITYSITHLA